MEGLAGYILRRLLFVPVTLFVVSYALFCITRWAPGDPISLLAGQRRDPEAIERVQNKYGLNDPISPVTLSTDAPFVGLHADNQYTTWVEDVVLHADFGPSYRFRDRDIWELLRPKIWISFQVGLYASVLAFIIGIPVGVFAAVRQGTWADPFIITIFLFFQSLHTLVVVPFLVLIFAAQLHWLPPGGFDGIFSKSMIIPTVALSLPGVAGIARLARTVTVQVLYDDFVRTARAKGMSETVVIWRHVARNSLVPMFTTVVGLNLVGLIEGALFTEILLGINGIGSFMYEAVQSQDYNVILAFVMLTTLLFVLANLVTDIALAMLDPRIRVRRQVR
jgi:ABC-type dipeptide/oligopeptide/nickel transport system permease component